MRDHVREAARWLLAERDTAGLRFLLTRARWDQDTLSEACALAREQEAAEAGAAAGRAAQAGAGRVDKRFEL